MPALADGPSVRVLTVPLDIHTRYWNPYDFDLLEFIGKNVAGELRRVVHWKCDIPCVQLI